MKDFQKVVFDLSQFKDELEGFRVLLSKADNLGEREHLQPFFKAAPQLSALISTPYVPTLDPADQLAYEFDIVGDFSADIEVGSLERRIYCMVELEDACPDGVFTIAGRKNTKEWSRRFEHGFSQLVDWFWMIDDQRQTSKFSDTFGSHPIFEGLLVIGRSPRMPCDTDDRRLRWREDKVLINSHKIHCITYDELLNDLSRRASNIAAVKPD